MASRSPFRLFQAARPMFRQQGPMLRRRVQTPAENPATVEAPPAAKQGGLSRFWNSKVGPKTVHFWAPVFKWGLVLAGVADLARPASSLSLTQNLALTATGAIWTRWCFIIRPQNLFLATVNFFLFLVGATQTTRVIMYQQSLKNEGTEEAVKELAQKEGANAEKIAENPGKAVEDAKKSANA